MRLRAYQRELASHVSGALKTNRAVLLQLPTGGGKTYIAAALIKKRRRERIWLICHRREILHQSITSLEKLGVPHGVIAPGYPLIVDRRVQVCSIDTLRGRLKNLPPPDLLVWDECHHVVAPSWEKIKRRFPRARQLGLTATPARLDGVGLGGHFDAMLSGPGTRELIDRAYLSEYRLFAPTIPDLRGVKTKMGDYDKGQLEERMAEHSLVGDVVEHYKRLAPKARAIVFAVSVAASKALAKRFADAGIPSGHIDGSTPAEDRQNSIADLAAGRIRVLSNVEVLTEGFDLPAIDAVLLLRPTKSFALYRQMIGRGLRTLPGKKKTIILDHAGLIHDHGLPDDEVEWTLEGVNAKPSLNEAGNSSLRRCPACSAIHAFAPACTECGHVYVAQDRTIEELYGELKEVRRLPGHESIREFATRLRMAPSNLRKVFKRLSFPVRTDRQIPVKAALKFLQSQRTSGNVAPLGYPLGVHENRGDFAKRVGRSWKSIHKLSAKGLPCAPNGWVNIEPALQWLLDWDKSHEKPVREIKVRTPSRKGESFKEFLSLARAKGGRDALVRAGLPIQEDGSVDMVKALDWVKTARLPKAAILRGYETRSQFARRIGVGKAGALRTLLRRGLPVERNGLIHIETALRWVVARNPSINVRERPRSNYSSGPSL